MQSFSLAAINCCCSPTAHTLCIYILISKWATSAKANNQQRAKLIINSCAKCVTASTHINFSYFANKFCGRAAHGALISLSAISCVRYVYGTHVYAKPWLKYSCIIIEVEVASCAITEYPKISKTNDAEMTLIRFQNKMISDLILAQFCRFLFNTVAYFRAAAEYVFLYFYCIL